MSKLVTSNNYAKPYRAFAVRCYDKVAGLMGTGHFDRQALVSAARRKTGLHDYGDETFVEALDVLLDSMQREAALTPFGHMVQKQRIVSALANRLRAEALFCAHPEILEQRLAAPVIIAGLQRTGTTMLHRLMAADPRARALLSWEALNPAPFEGEDAQASARRRQAKLAERSLAYIAPEFFAIHPVEAEAPEEDVLLLDLSFMSQAPEATMHVPSYASWLEAQDNTPAYAYLRKLLLLLQWQRGGAHWVLKTPHHMEHLDLLAKVFDEAVVIQTHRDPRKTMGSFCSMVAHGRGVFSDRVDAREVGRHWSRKVERMMRRSIEHRASDGALRVIDVAYADLIDDPERQLRRIYAFAGLSFDSAVQQAVTAARRTNVRNKYGRHVYRLADFGLSGEGIDERFAFYKQHYAIANESGGAS